VAVIHEDDAEDQDLIENSGSTLILRIGRCCWLQKSGEWPQKRRLPNEKSPAVGLVGMGPRLEPYCWRGFFLSLKHNKRIAKLNYRAKILLFVRDALTSSSSCRVFSLAPPSSATSFLQLCQNPFDSPLTLPLRPHPTTTRGRVDVVVEAGGSGER
jgi:hypothetical protein